MNLSAGIPQGPGVSENIEGAVIGTELTQTHPGGIKPISNGLANVKESCLSTSGAMGARPGGDPPIERPANE